MAGKITLIVLAVVLVALIFGSVAFDAIGSVLVVLGNALKTFAQLPIFPSINGIFGG